MAYSSYQAFRDDVLLRLDGENSNQSIATATMDALIEDAEERIYYDGEAPLRVSTMEVALNLPVTSNAVTLPADFLELKEAYFSGYPPLEVVPLQRIRELESYTPSGGITRYVAHDGLSLRFYPLASGNLLGTYYKRHQPLKTGVWANQTTFARYPKLFLYAALAEAAIFLGDAQMGEAYANKFSEKLSAANRHDRWQVYNGSPLRMRAR